MALLRPPFAKRFATVSRLKLRHTPRANAAVGRTDEAQYITEEYLAELEAEMFAAAEALEFERAAAIRDRITKMRDSMGKQVGEVDFHADDNGKGRGPPPRRSSSTAEEVELVRPDAR